VDYTARSGFFPEERHEYVNLGKPAPSPASASAASYGSPKWRDWVLDYDASKPFFKGR
jgi:hypothetical protein